MILFPLSPILSPGNLSCSFFRLGYFRPSVSSSRHCSLGGSGVPLAPVAAAWGVLADPRQALMMGDSHARRVAKGPPTDVLTDYAPPPTSGPGRPWIGGEATRLLNGLLRWRLTCPGPDAVVVSLGGNLLTSQAAQQTVATAVTDSLRKITAFPELVGAPGATVIVLTAVPRLHLSGEDLSEFREAV